MSDLNRDVILDQIKNNLVMDRDKLLGRNQDNVGIINAEPDRVSGDEYDLAQNELLETLAIDLNNRELSLLEKINSALDKFMDKSYGVCESCGESIPLGRLKALPTSSLCVDCQENEEIEDRMDNLVAGFLSNKEANA